MTIPNIVSVTGPIESRCYYKLTGDISTNRNNCFALGGLFNDQVQPQECSLVPAVCPQGSTEAATGECIVTSTTTVKPGGGGNRGQS